MDLYDSWIIIIIILNFFSTTYTYVICIFKKPHSNESIHRAMFMSVQDLQPTPTDIVHWCRQSVSIDDIEKTRWTKLHSNKSLFTKVMTYIHPLITITDKPSESPAKVFVRCYRYAVR